MLIKRFDTIGQDNVMYKNGAQIRCIAQTDRRRSVKQEASGRESKNRKQVRMVGSEEMRARFRDRSLKKVEYSRKTGEGRRVV